MGGKKTVGSHPTRGHYQNHSSGRSIKSTQHTTETEIPFSQEFSLFCADVIADSAAPNSAAASDSKYWGSTSRHVDSSEHYGHWYNPSSALNGLGGTNSQITELQAQLEGLRADVKSLEERVASSTAGDSDEKPKSSTVGGNMNHEMKRLVDLLKTVEGRQKSIQSKISYLDNIFGPSTAAWAEGSEKLRFIMEYFDMMNSPFAPAQGESSYQSYIAPSAAMPLPVFQPPYGYQGPLTPHPFMVPAGYPPQCYPQYPMVAPSANGQLAPPLITTFDMKQHTASDAKTHTAPRTINKDGEQEENQSNVPEHTSETADSNVSGDQTQQNSEISEKLNDSLNKQSADSDDKGDNDSS